MKPSCQCLQRKRRGEGSPPHPTATQNMEWCHCSAIRHDRTAEQPHLAYVPWCLCRLVTIHPRVTGNDYLRPFLLSPLCPYNLCFPLLPFAHSPPSPPPLPFYQGPLWTNLWETNREGTATLRFSTHQGALKLPPKNPESLVRGLRVQWDVPRPLFKLHFSPWWEGDCYTVVCL